MYADTIKEMIYFNYLLEMSKIKILSCCGFMK